MALQPLDQWLARRTGLPEDRLSGTALRDWLLTRLRETVAHAQAHSPFYAAHLAGTDPAAIRTLDDFARLPRMTAVPLRDAPERLLCVSQDEIARIVTLATSGTTGPPKRIFNTAQDLEATTDFFHWGMSNIAQPGDTVLVLMPGDRPDGVGRLLAEGLSRMGARAVCHGVMDNADHALDQCVADDVRCVVGCAPHVNALACAWRRRRLPRGMINSVLLCWDEVPDAVARSCERIFGCSVFRHWGMIETGLGGAVECSPGSGLHLRETDVFVEITDPETGATLPDGERGEMVVTTPLRRGMPLIRYRTGDAGRILPGACGCGSPLRRLDPVVRRLATDGAGADGPALHELNEALYGVDGVADFAAWFKCGENGAMLELDICGQGAELERNVRAALERVPSLRHSGNAESTTIAITFRPDPGPAVPGLGKRRILTDRENEP